MTEEIIIDSVNVAWCEYFAKQNEHSCLEENGNCENISNCYYKQLIRLKQQHNDDTEEIAKLGLDVTILEQENKQMKSTLEEINTIVKQLLQGVSSNCINNTPYLTALSLIETKINEVLNED